jgi:hypothetical protein
METKEKVKTFKLPNKTVLVMPVKRKGSWLPAGHENEFLFKHSTYKVGVPRHGRNGELIDPLTKEERTFFESKASGLSLEVGDLSIYKKENNYWKNFIVTLDKNVMQLDLSNPMDYIRYKVLLTNTDQIAPSEAQSLRKATYKFKVVEEGAIEEAKAKKVTTKKDAYILFGKIMDSSTKLRNFLNVYYHTRKGTKKVTANSSLEFLQVETEKVLEKDIDGFISTLEDPSYETKVLIYKALEARALTREGLTYKTTEGLVIGDNLQEVVSFFDNDVNNEEILRIKARIENAK